jgi:hypothetical protein
MASPRPQPLLIHFGRVLVRRKTDAGWYFTMFGWDPSDIDGACHHGGDFAWPDEHQLAYCVEGRLERALLQLPLVYAR